MWWLTACVFLRCMKRQRASCPCRHRRPQLHALILPAEAWLTLKSALCEVPAHPWAGTGLSYPHSLTATPIVSSRSNSSPHTRGESTTFRQLSHNRITQIDPAYLMMAAKVCFPYPHGLLSLCCWYSVWVCVCIPPLLWKKLEKHTKKKLSFSQSGSLIWY